MWLYFETWMEGGKKMARKLQWKICTKVQANIQSRKNFNNKWIIGNESVHGKQCLRPCQKQSAHACDEAILIKEWSTAEGLGPSAYAPIVRALNKLPDEERRRLQFNFDTAHFMATEKLSFLKYHHICEVQAHHWVNLGTLYISNFVYINEMAGKSFIYYSMCPKKLYVSFYENGNGTEEIMDVPQENA